MTNKSTSLEFISLEEAANMKEGVRITFIPGLQAIYAEALKNICYVKKIEIIRVLHPFMGTDKVTGKDRQAELYALTSQTSLPTMLYKEERPRNVWIEQLALAEKIGSPDSKSLIPENFKERADMFGLCSIVLGEDGLVWNMRILSDSPLARKYGYSVEASSEAPNKIAEIIKLIDTKLSAQKEKGSKFLIGDSLSAVDIYWSTVSMTVLPASLKIMPKTKQNEGMLLAFEGISKIPQIAEATSELIHSHRDYILKTYCETPAVLGGNPV